MSENNNKIRYLGTCKFCKKEIYGTHHNKYQAHQRWCLKNPNRNKTISQFQQASKLGSQVANKNRQINAAKLNKKYNHLLQCKKCKRNYILKISDKDFKSGKYSKYCSRSCANTRFHTKSEKNKIGKSVSKLHEHICLACKIAFMHKGTNIHKIYCNSCYEKIFGFKRGFKKINNQNQIIINNNTQLHNTKCFNCKTIIWCKTSDDVYCYECAKKLGKTVHQLYTPTGKKLFSKYTKEKIKQQAIKRIKNGTHKGWISRYKHSYPEKFWINVLNNNKIQYIEEASVPGYLYRLDFKLTLPNGKIVDLEIDGKQHLYADRKKHDKIRDQRIRDLGYLIYRITWNSLKFKFGKLQMKAKINQFLWWLDKVSK